MLIFSRCKEVSALGLFAERLQKNIFFENIDNLLKTEIYGKFA